LEFETSPEIKLPSALQATLIRLEATVYKIMETLPTVLLRPGEADRVVAGHPWIFWIDSTADCSGV